MRVPGKCGFGDLYKHIVRETHIHKIFGNLTYRKITEIDKQVHNTNSGSLRKIKILGCGWALQEKYKYTSIDITHQHISLRQKPFWPSLTLHSLLISL